MGKTCASPWVKTWCGKLRQLLVQALNVFNKKWVTPRARDIPAAIVAAFFLMLFVSLGMLWLGDKLNATGMALTRFMARGQAPLTAEFYPTVARDRITVLTYDQDFLESNQLAWPLSYQQHADVLLRLAQDPVAKPKAIFLDITFGQLRDDPTVGALRQTLCTLQNAYKVPVFLAALIVPETGQLGVRPGLMPAAGESGSPCFTLVGVDYLPDTLDGIAWTYALTRHLTPDGQWASGPAPEGNTPAYRSAALSIAQDAAGVDTGPETVPMALVWGKKSAAMDESAPSLKGCNRSESFEWHLLVPGVLRQLWADAPAQRCPYHATLSMDQLNGLSDEQHQHYMKDRFLMVGAQVPGFNDFALSPVHGLVPGIQMHAMALDNLLVYQRNYKLNEEWAIPPVRSLWPPAILSVLAVFLVHLALRSFRRWLRAPVNGATGPTAPLAGSATPPASGAGMRLSLQKWYQRISGFMLASHYRGEMGKGAGWLGSLWLKYVAAMFVIGLLQWQFRLGMLPVVELVTMTLVAEGLGYMNYLRKFFLGEEDEDKTSDPCPCQPSSAISVVSASASASDNSALHARHVK